eukprot:CAMPEP_0115867268 /NCGR_PEP_ID=MMETSP0287-20121206/20681_1 /TAXON_ID=412157 /ORGANISM="Chrysochromulina rotalis, Strain UIO044" /LENGTH=116 /DNA_ID=CAMNT_0003321869 /DNA_START=120 /DNA_END=467 /DNA_ORIENTATION=+
MHHAAQRNRHASDGQHSTGLGLPLQAAEVEMGLGRAARRRAALALMSALDSLRLAPARRAVHGAVYRTSMQRGASVELLEAILAVGQQAFKQRVAVEHIGRQHDVLAPRRRVAPEP